MEARFGGPQRDPQLGRDVGQRHAEVVVHDHDGPPFGIEPSECRVEELAIGHVGRRVAGEGVRDRSQLNLNDATPTSTRDVKAGVNGQSMEPWLKAVWVA